MACLPPPVGAWRAGCDGRSADGAAQQLPDGRVHLAVQRDRPAGDLGAHPPRRRHRPAGRRPDRRRTVARGPPPPGRREPSSWPTPGPTAAADRSGSVRTRGSSTQNSLPSGSASTTQVSSPWPTSAWVAPRSSRRATSACWSAGRKSRWSRFFTAFRSGTRANSKPGSRSGAARISNSSGSSLTTTQSERRRPPRPERDRVSGVDDDLLPRPIPSGHRTATVRARVGSTAR